MHVKPPISRDAPIGGQAVLEGVMMRGPGSWAVATRAGSTSPTKDDADELALGEINVEWRQAKSRIATHKFARLPIIRGIVALGESLKIGFNALEISANAQLQEAEQRDIGKATWSLTLAASLLLSVALFFLLPLLVTFAARQIFDFDSSLVFVVIEKVVRIGIFLTYLVLVSRIPDLQRVFQYHGAEHKVIFCYEAGQSLTPENAQKFSRFHPRCGTSFLLIVMIIAVIVFAPLGTPAWYILVASRIIGIPLIAGIAFEAIKWFGKNRHRSSVRILMSPGLQLQRLTTREPTFGQLAVAIVALEAVLEHEDLTQAVLGAEIAA